jgi:SAM-dependent methyltransferase
MFHGIIGGTVARILRPFGYEITRVKKIHASGGLASSASGYERLSRDFSKYHPLKVHFGCGPRVIQGWVNIDLTYQSYEEYAMMKYPPDMRGDESDFYALDITRVGLPLPNDSVDVVFHEDFLEHLNQRDQIAFLAETLRALRPGGVHRVNTPNLLSSMATHSSFKEGKAGVYLDEWNKWGHLNVLTSTMLEEMARMVGYSDINFNSRNKSVSSLIPMEYRPDMSRPEHDGNIFADLIK